MERSDEKGGRGLRQRARERLATSRTNLKTMPAEDVAKLVHELQVHQVELEIQGEELRRSQSALQASRDRYVELYDSAPVGYVSVNSNLRIQKANRTACTQFGRSRSQLTGARIAALVHTDDRDRLHIHYRRVTQRGNHTCSIQAQKPSQPTTYFRLESTLVGGETSESGDFRTVVIDISSQHNAEIQRKKVEEKLRQANKMEAIGRLAGGVAHDFNNLLTAILGNCEYLLEVQEGPAGNREALEQIQQATLQAADISRRLLTFSRGDTRPQTSERVDVGLLVSNQERLVRHLLKDEVQLNISISGDALIVLAPPGHLEQVVMNLLVNATDAVDANGRIDVRVEAVEVDESEVADNPGAEVGPHVRIHIRDDGYGIAPDVMKRIFDPFFTTKDVGKGTGLGLSTSHGAVTDLSGHLRVQSEVGQGATFAVYLPRATAEANAEPDDHRESTSLSRSANTTTILLCEDQPAILDMMQGCLEEAGYRVLATGDGLQALEAVRNHPGAIDLLISDVVMPGLDGGELARRLRQTTPDLKVLFISGYHTDHLSRSLPGETPKVLSKPFGPTALLKEIRSMLPV